VDMIKEEITQQILNEAVKVFKDEFSKEFSQQIEKAFQDNIGQKIDQMKSTVTRALIMGGLTFLGLIFVFLAAIDYIPRILGLSEGAAYSLIGVLLIGIGLIYRQASKE
jgi:4-hydroxybenzoate polyprenyltransferase